MGWLKINYNDYNIVNKEKIKKAADNTIYEATRNFYKLTRDIINKIYKCKIMPRGYGYYCYLKKHQLAHKPTAEELEDIFREEDEDGNKV